MRHIINKRTAITLYACLRIVGAQLLDLFFARLMNHLRTHIFVNQCQSLRHHSIQSLRPQTAANHRQFEFATSPCKTRLRFGDIGNHLFDRIADPHPFGKHIRKAHQYPFGDFCQQLIRHARDGVLFVQNNRNPCQFCSQTTRDGDVTPHAEHHIRTHTLIDFARLRHRFEQAKWRKQFGLQTLATHAAKYHRMKFITVLRHQTRFHRRIADPTSTAEPCDGVPCIGQCLRHSQPRHNMAACAPCHDEDGFRMTHTTRPCCAPLR